jgi:OOP family OmpA-OmpF porin
MTKKLVVAMFTAVALTGSAGAFEQAAPGFYIGADIGQADFGADEDTTFKLYGGYQINRHFAAEVGYGMLYDKGGSEGTALELVAVGIFPITNQFSVYGKLGLASVEQDFPGGSDDGTELTYGFGVQFDFTPKIGVRGQWQRYDTDREVDVLSVGVVFRF